MNNDEKILILLEAMQEEQKRTSDRLDKIDGRLDKMDGRLDRVENDILSMKEELSDVRIAVSRVETDHGRQLGLLVDGHMLNVEKLSRIEREVERHDDILMRHAL